MSGNIGVRKLSITQRDTHIIQDGVATPREMHPAQVLDYEKEALGPVHYPRSRKIRIPAEETEVDGCRKLEQETTIRAISTSRSLEVLHRYTLYLRRAFLECYQRWSPSVILDPSPMMLI